MWQSYRDRGVQVLVVDVQESEEDARRYAERSGFTFPVLLDRDGAATAPYAPEGVLPEIPREQVPIASNLLIDREGVVRYYTLLDTDDFDAELVELRGLLDELLEAER